MTEAPLRIAMIVHEFPIVGHPEHGGNLYELAKELQELADVRVYCALPKYASFKCLQPRTYSPQGER